jgi:hypothetical protein
VGARRRVIAVTVAATAAVVVLAIGESLGGAVDEGARGSAVAAGRGLAVVAGLATAIAIVLAQSGRRWPAIALAGGAALLVAMWVAFVSVAAPRDGGAPPLLESDRAGLEDVEVEGRHWLAHRTLGFRLPQPPIAMRPSDAIVNETLARAGVGFAEVHQLWAFASEGHDLTVVIDLARTERTDVERVLESNTASIDGVEQTPIRREGRCASGSFGADLGGGGRLEGRVFGFEDPRSHRAFHLTITIVGPISAGAAEFLEEVVVPCG